MVPLTALDAAAALRRSVVRASHLVSLLAAGAGTELLTD